MDIYELSVDAVEFTAEVFSMSSTITRGIAAVLKITLEQDGDAVSVLGDTFETRVPGNDGTTLILANSAHTIIETAGVNVGRVNVALTAAQTLLVKDGRGIQFQTKDAGTTSPGVYWGEIDEIRNQIE